MNPTGKIASRHEKCALSVCRTCPHSNTRNAVGKCPLPPPLDATASPAAAAAATDAAAADATAPDAAAAAADAARTAGEAH